MKIGIPKSMFYYLQGDIIVNFFKKLGESVVISPDTNRKIIEDGIKYAPDEMCLSMKNYIGHVYYLKDKCDYILVPRIDNYYTFNQTCTNFLAARDIISNLFDVKVLDYNINLNDKENLKKGLFKLGNFLGYKKDKINASYIYAIRKNNKNRKRLIKNNMDKLNSDKKKVLLISHSYIIHDKLIGKPVLDMLKKENIDIISKFFSFEMKPEKIDDYYWDINLRTKKYSEIIYSDALDSSMCRKLSRNISEELYWKYSKESIGAYEMIKNRIDGVVFLSTFPCGLDSLVNELLILKLDKPYLNIIIDDLSADNGLETRIESFSDILNCYKK